MTSDPFRHDSVRTKRGRCSPVTRDLRGSFTPVQVYSPISVSGQGFPPFSHGLLCFRSTIQVVPVKNLRMI